MENDTDLKEAFDAVFIAPIAQRRFKSARGRSHWLEAEGWTDSIAGPLWSIVDSGGCEYVYTREDQYFTGVHDPASLRKRLLEWQTRLGSKVEQFAPVSDAEHEDLRFMKSLVAAIRAIIERAIKVEDQRRQSSPSRDLGGNSTPRSPTA